MPLNPLNIVRILMEEFGTPTQDHSTSAREREVAGQISGIIRSNLYSCVDFEEDVELVFEDPLFAEDIHEAQLNELADDFVDEVDPENYSESDASGLAQDSGPSSSSWSASQLTPVNRKFRSDIPFSKRKRAVEYWRSSVTQKRRKTSSVISKFSFVTSERQLEYWESQLEQEGPRHEKLRQIAIKVRQQFVEARASKKALHDVDLRRWALVEARRLGLVAFKASKDWVRRFKKLNRIVSRKITRFVSLVMLDKDDNITSAAESFVGSVRPKISSYGAENVYNTDQSGFSLEMHGGRTLEHIGTRRVEAQAQSVSATTHSCTIMPTISASGKLLSPLVIVFKEPGGKFGPNVQDTMVKPENIFPIAAKSSIMGKAEIKIWYKDVFLPKCGASAMLLVDSLKAYNCVQDSKDEDKEIEIGTIPPHATGMIQPLDVYFFRIWKTFARKISEFIILENEEIFLRQRNNIIKLQSLIHNQLSAPKFETFRQVAWHKSGYFTHEEPEFEHPINVCFKSNDLYCSQCPNLKLMKCAWCNQCLCGNHALNELHYHKML